MNNVVIFGGCGFIGLYYAEELSKLENYKKIYLIDLKEPTDKYLKLKFDKLLNKYNVKYINSDVRKSLDTLNIEKVSHIADFAAVHREPGHKDFEYYNTNVNGSKNICKFADDNSCKNILFASSIAVYGKGDHKKDETTTPNPNTPYGKSKLESEQNYLKWYSDNKDHKVLTICRPGVVFGPGEKGNVTRLVKIIKKKFFFYLGNKELKKAGIYIRELITILKWANDSQINGSIPKSIIFNSSFVPCPTLKDYVEQICKVHNIKNNFISIPGPLIKFLILLSCFVTKNLKSSSNFNFTRLMKLFRSNNITSNYLLEKNYPFKYNIYTSLTDWKNLHPSDWE